MIKTTKFKIIHTKTLNPIKYDSGNIRYFETRAKANKHIKETKFIFQAKEYMVTSKPLKTGRPETRYALVKDGKQTSISKAKAEKLMGKTKTKTVNKKAKSEIVAGIGVRFNKDKTVSPANIRHALISKLQDEIIFLQTTKVRSESTSFDHYDYHLCGDLSESRHL